MRIQKVNSVLFLTLLLISFFGIRFMHSGYFYYLFWLIVILLGYRQYKSATVYSRLVLIYVLFVFSSCVYSWMYNGQRLHTVIGRSFDYFALLFFFVLLQSGITAKETEKVLLRLSVLFCICYIIQWIISPVALFSSAVDEDQININSNQFRMRLPGSICCYCLFLYGINRFLLTKDFRYALYIILGFIPIIIQGFRSLTALSVFSAFLMIPFVLRSGKKTVLYAILGSIVCLAALRTSLVQSKISEMMARQESNQTFDNEDYIRFSSLNYYWNEQFTKPYEKVVGGGNPVDVRSRYFKNIQSAIDDYGFYWVDLGIIGLAMVIGVPAVIILVILYLRCMWKMKEPKYQYIRFTLFIVLIGSIFTSKELYRDGNILIFSLFLYLEYIYHIQDCTSHSLIVR